VDVCFWHKADIPTRWSDCPLMTIADPSALGCTAAAFFEC
jgi:hypothetical protein